MSKVATLTLLPFRLRDQIDADFSFRKLYYFSMADEKKKLIKELSALLPDIEAKGLQFLKEQATVLLYNQEVEKKNAAMLKEQAAVPPVSAEESEEKRGKKKKKESPPPLPEVYIEQLKNGKFFNIRFRNAKSFMDLQEIRSLYKIARAAANESEGSRRLYSWLKKERSDVLADGNISGGGSVVMKMIYRELLETFSAE